MRLVTCVLGATLLSVAPACAGVQVSEERPWAEARACLDTADIPICWLQLIGRQRGPLGSDPDLREQPALLAQITPADETPAAPPDDRDLPAPVQAYLDALDAALDQVAAGAPADAFLAPLQTLPVTGAHAIANPLLSEVQSFGRLDAYNAMALALSDRYGDTQAAVVMAPLLAAWERDLAGVDEASLFNGSASTLAQWYASVGDETSARRALIALAPENEPALIEGLVDLGRLEEAVQISNAADASRSQDRIRREIARSERLAQEQMAEMRAFATAYAEEAGLGDLLAGLIAQSESIEAMTDGDVTQADQEAFDAAFASYSEEERQSVLADHLEAAAAETVGFDEEALRQEAEDELNRARTRLMAKAEQDGRTDLVLPVARQVFGQALEPASQTLFGAGDLSQALRLIVRAAPRDEAIAALETAETHAWTRRDGGLQLLLPAIHDGWRSVGRPERAEALITAWRPIALAQNETFARGDRGGDPLGDDGQPGAAQGLQNIFLASDDFTQARALGGLAPDAELRRDFAAGRGASHLEQRLAAVSAAERASVLISCRYLASEARDAAGAAACAERWADLAETPAMRLGAAEALLAAARLTARIDAPRAIALARRGVVLGSATEAEAADPMYSDFQFIMTLQELSKALLRAEGRLPASPSARP